MLRSLLLLLLAGMAFGQTAPSHVLLTENLTDSTHPKVLGSVPSTGADSYNVYEASIDNLQKGCPAFGSTLAVTQVWPDGSIHRAGSPAYVLDTTLAGGVPAGIASINYPDDPNPGLGQLPALKQAGGRGWCYAVSSVTNGIESAPSIPQEVWLGFSAYYSWSYHTACNVGKSPYPYPPSDYHPRLYYRDPAGNNHQFAYLDNAVIVDAGGNDEIEFHMPTIAMDGTPVPLLDASKNGQAKYFLEFTTPDGYNAVKDIIPSRQGDHVYYNEISTSFVWGHKNYWEVCPVEPGSWWQDVSY